MAASIREALEEAVTKSEPEEPKKSAPATPAPAPETKAERVEESSKTEKKEESAPKAESRTVEEKPEQPVVEEKKPDVPREKPPASWKAGAKERWPTLPPEAREEIIRREREISTGLQQAAEKSKFAEHFQRTIEPYRAVMAAEGVTDPVVAVQNLLQTAASLRMGTPAQKAQTIAKLIEYYGVDIPALDSVLSGNAQQAISAPTNQFEEILNRRLAPFEQLITGQQQYEQQTQRELQQQASQTIEQFTESPEAEFFEDVREDMADMLDVAARRGRSMTIQEAYQRAIALHPEIYKIISQRRAATNPDTARAKNAASSISGAPAGGPTTEPTDIRSALLAAMDKNR